MDEKSKRLRLEQKLDKSIRALLGKGAADYAPEDWRSLREQLRLTLLYRGRYVAFRDHYQGGGETGLLARREVLCASRSLVAIGKYIDKLPKNKQRGIHIDAVEP